MLAGLGCRALLLHLRRSDVVWPVYHESEMIIMSCSRTRALIRTVRMINLDHRWASLSQCNFTVKLYCFSVTLA